MSVLIFFAQFLIGTVAFWVVLSGFMFVMIGGDSEYRNLPLPKVALKISKFCGVMVGAFAGLVLIVIGAVNLIQYLGTLA